MIVADTAHFPTDVTLSVKEQAVMENIRQFLRAHADLPVTATDKAEFTSGQVIDLTIRGCGLRLTKPLRLGQYVMLMISPSNEIPAVQCDLAQVQWATAERAGVRFLRMSSDNERRLYQIWGDQLTSEFWA